MDRTEDSILSEVSQDQKAIFLLYVQYRPNPNTSISWKTGHTMGKSLTEEGG
jgi:hypothetical protein